MQSKKKEIKTSKEFIYIKIYIYCNDGHTKSESEFYLQNCVCASSSSNISSGQINDNEKHSKTHRDEITIIVQRSAMCKQKCAYFIAFGSHNTLRSVVFYVDFSRITQFDFETLSVSVCPVFVSFLLFFFFCIFEL